LKTKTLPEPILVGREKEIAELQRCLYNVFEGKGNTIFIRGEAGTGKTRIVTEFLKTAAEKNVIILTSRCLSKTTVPYSPFVEALESLSYYDGKNGDLTYQQLNIKSLLAGPECSFENEKIENINPQSWKDLTYLKIARELVFLSVKRPIIFFIDDAHWADSASLSLLHYISRNVSSEHILIIASYRSEELNPISEGQLHPLLDVIRQMRRDGIYEEIKLANLAPPQIATVAESMLEGKPSKELVDKLSVESLGNPLFVVESLRMLFEQGNLVRQESEWSLSVDNLGVPTKIREIILRRIGLLKSEQRRVLDIASVIGDRFDAELLGAVLKQDIIKILEILNTIAQSNLLVYSEEDFFRFDYPTSREVFYEEIREPLRKGYHARIAECIENNVRFFQPGELAHHYILAGNKEKSIKYALVAGKDALVRFSNSEAIKYFNYVLNSISDDIKYNNEIVSALEGLGDSYFANSKYKEANEIYEKLTLYQDEQLKVRAFRKAMDSAFFQGNFVHLIELTNKAKQISGIDHLENARVQMNIGRALSNLGQAKEGLEYMEAALNVFEKECSLLDTARALMGVAVIALMMRQYEKSIAAAARSVALNDELGDLRGQMDSNNRAGQTFSSCGFGKEALEKFDMAVETGAKIHDNNRMAEATAWSSLVLENKGDLEGAISRSTKAEEYAKGTDSYWTLGAIYSSFIREYAKLGNLTAAEQYYEKLNSLPGVILSNPAVGLPLVKAMLYTLKGEWTQANKCFEEMLKGYDLRPTPFDIRAHYAWALSKQGKAKEAEFQIKANNKIKKELYRRLEKAALQISIINPNEITKDKEFLIRFDLINISQRRLRLVKLEPFILPEFKINNAPKNYEVQKCSINFKERTLNPLQVETLNLIVQPMKLGNFKLAPSVAYIDSHGKPKSIQSKTIQIIVHPSTVKIEIDKERTQTPPNFEFRCEAAQKAFDFLLNSFVNDYARLKFPKERCGWRTLMDVVKVAKISQYSLYGQSNRKGEAMSELERSNLVETRLFTGERGRAGRVLKIRVIYENEFVNKLIRQRTG
jgi:tetratricopeptide (TPR) repeat protein